MFLVILIYLLSSIAIKVFLYSHIFHFTGCNSWVNFFISLSSFYLRLKVKEKLVNLLQIFNVVCFWIVSLRVVWIDPIAF
jgi:hypothetical protein